MNCSSSIPPHIGANEARKVWNTRPIEDALRAELAAAIARAEKAESELAAEKAAHDDTRAYWRKLSMGVAQDADTDIATLKARAEKAEAERDVLIKIALRYSPCPNWMSFDGEYALFRGDCSRCQKTFEQLSTCLKEFAAQEAAKREGGGE